MPLAPPLNLVVKRTAIHTPLSRRSTEKKTFFAAYLVEISINEAFSVLPLDDVPLEDLLVVDDPLEAEPAQVDLLISSLQDQI